MSTATMTPESPTVTAPAPAEVCPGDQCVEMAGIGWDGYETLLKLRGDASLPKMIYVDGDLLLLSPALPHERLNRRYGFFLDQLILRLRLPSLDSGQTTFRRRGKRGGVEGDHSYYLKNEPRVRGKMQIDLRTDPPPDLAIEVVHTHGPNAALKVYQRLSVPDVWVCRAGSLDFMVRQANGRYSKSPNSLAFPFLTSAELLEWMDRPYAGPDFEWKEAIERWVIDVLVPRARGLRDRDQAEGIGVFPVDRDAAIVLATRLVVKKRPGHRVSVRSIQDEGNKWCVDFDIEVPVDQRTPPDDFAIVYVYKKTGVAREMAQR